MRKTRKSQIWISAVLYILIAAVAMVIILQAGIPLLNKMKDRTTFERSKSVLANLDQKIVEVAAEGQGSQRVVPVDIREGNIIVDENNNKLKWELETKSEVIEPRTSLQLGNLKIYSNIEVDTVETTTEYTISNSRVKFVINKITQDDTLDVNDLIKEVYYLNPPQETLVPGKFTFTICDPGALTGKGYTEMVPAGDNTHVGSVKIIAHMLNSNAPPNGCGNSYDLEIILDSQADFLKTRVINLDKR